MIKDVIYVLFLYIENTNMAENINAPKGIASLEGLITTQADAEQVQQTTELPTEETLVEQPLAAEIPTQEEPIQEEQPVVQTPTTPVQSQPTDLIDDHANAVKSISKNPYVNTAQEALDKYSNDNRSKAMLLSDIDSNPEAALPLMAAGLITPKDLANHRNSRMIYESQQSLQALDSAWIEAPEDNIFKGAANVVLQGLTGAVSGLLAIPDVVITHGAVMAQEPMNDTDRAYQTYLLGREKVRELYLAKDDLALTKQEREKAQADYEAMKPVVSKMYADLQQQPEFERAEEKYITKYYEDNAINFIGSFRKSISGVANHEAVNELANSISDSFGENVDALYAAKDHLDQGNLLKAAGSALAGLAGLGADTVEAIVRNPRAVLDITAQSFGMMAAGGAVGKGAGIASSLLGATSKSASVASRVGQVFNYQSMFAADAYAQFEQEYGHLPEAQQAILLNGVTTLASILALGGDEFMLNSVKKLALRPSQIKTTAIKDVLSNTALNTSSLPKKVLVDAPVRVLSSKVATGATFETIQEFTESLATQYAALQDLDKIDLQEATVEALMASGAGGLTGAVGEIGSTLRKASKGKLVSRLEDAKAGYKVQRSDITDIDSAKQVISESLTQMNQVDESLVRDEEGEVINSQANASLVAGLYDTILSNIAGLDSVLAGVNAAKDVSLRKTIEDSVRKGTPLNEVIKEVVADLTPFSDPMTVLSQLNVEGVAPEQLQESIADIQALAGNVSGIINQVITTANQLTSNYDLESIVASERAQRQADKAEQKAKVRELKKQKAAQAEDTEAELDSAPAKAKSKFTVSDVLANFDPNLATVDTETEVNTETTETTETVFDEVVATDEEINEALDSASDSAPDTRLNSPTVDKQSYDAVLAGVDKAEVPVSGKSGNLQKFDNAINTVLAKLEASPTTKDAKIYVGAVNNLAKDIALLASKPSLTEAEKSNAVILTNAIASYVNAYANTPNVNKAELGLLLGKNGIKYSSVFKALGAKGVKQSELPRLFNIIQSAINSNAPRTQTVSSAIDRPAQSVTNTKRLGVHTTTALKELKVPEVFSILNGLMANLLNGSVENAPQELMTDVLSVMTASPAEFDNVYTAITKTDVEYAAQRKAKFTDVASNQAKEQEAANSYLQLVDYFKRVDPSHRDLTYVLSKYLPEVNNALNTKLSETDIPSEFNKEFNQKAKELVYKELPVDREQLPTDSTELVSMLGSGLEAIQLAGKKEEFVHYLVNEEGLSKNGSLVATIDAHLSDTTGELTLPLALVNPTMVSRVNTFVNQNTLPNTVKEVDTGISAQWSSNVYSGVKEALSRLQLSSDAMSVFTTPDTLQGGMYQVFNILSVLEDPSHENYEKVVSSFTSDELAELKTALPYIQSMRNMYSHMFAKNDGLSPFMQNNKVMDLFETMSSKSHGADNFLHPNLSGIIAQTALEYAMSDGILALGFNKQEAVESIVGDAVLAQRADVRDALSSGSTLAALAPRLGKQIVKRLGIQPIENKATSHDLAQLENSVGHMALHGLEKLGIINAETVYFTRGNDVSVHTQAGFGAIKAKVEGRDVFRMYSFNEEKLAELDKLHGNAFKALAVSKSLSEKLYGKEEKANIATTPEEIQVKGKDATLIKIAKAMASKSPQYLHQEKLAVFNNLGRHLQEVMFGGGIDLSTVHQHRQKNAEAKNRRALSDIGRIAHHAMELDKAGTNKFFLHQIVGGNTRFTGHNPKGIDPIGSSAARFLVNVEEKSEIIIGSDNPTDIAEENMFYKGMLQALDMAKPEEISESRAKELFDTLATNQTMLDAVELINISKTEELSDAQSDQLELLLKELDGESIAHTLDAVYVYSNYLAAKQDGVFTFDATMFMEIDGKNNGSALGIMQNAPIAALEDFNRMAKSVGLNFDIENGVSFGEIKMTTEEFLDAYQHLAKAAGDVGSDILLGNISEEEVKELLGNKYSSVANRSVAYSVVMKLLAGKTGALVVDNEVTGEGRNLFKQVLMTILYGAGITTQDRYFANKIADTHLDTLEGFAQQEDSPELRAQVKEYFATIRELGLPTTFYTPRMDIKGWQTELLKEHYAFQARDIAVLVGRVENTIGITYRKALETPTYKNIITQANSAVESSNVAHLRLHFASIRLLNKYKESKGIEGDLTVAQEREFQATYIKPLIGTLSYPLSNLVEEKIAGVSTSSSTIARQHIPQSAFDAAKAKLDAEKSKNPDFKGTINQFLPEQYSKQMVQDFAAGTNTTLRSQILSRVLKSPEQSVAPSGVHAQDSSIQASVAMMYNTPFLNVFDALGGTPRTMAQLQGAANKAFDAVTGNYNFYTDLANTYSDIDKAMTDQLSQEELAAIDNEVANALGLPDFSYTEYMGKIKQAYTQIGERAKEVKELLISVDQYPFTETSFYLNPNKKEGSLDDIQVKYAESLDLDKFPSVIGSGLVNEGRNLALNAAQVVETDTDSIREVIDSGSSLYSTSKNTVGEYVKTTLSNFKQSLMDFAEVTTPEASKALKLLKNELDKLYSDAVLAGRLVLPKLDVNNLDAEILKMLQESTLPTEAKKVLNHPHTIQLLKNVSPESIEAGVYTKSSELNLWLSLEDNIKWLNAPINSLLSEGFYNTIKEATVFGINLSPEGIIKELVVSPNSRAYVGKEVRGKANNLVSSHMLEYVQSLDSNAFGSLLIDSGIWGRNAKNKVTSITGLNTALLLGIIENPKGRSREWYIPDLGNIRSDAALNKAYFGNITSRIANLHKRRGDYTTGNLTPEIVKQRILDTLVPDASVTTEDVADNVVTESNLDVSYVDNGAEVTYLGQTFPLVGEVKITEEKNKLVVTWESDTPVDVSHIWEATGNQLAGMQVGAKKAEIKAILGTPTFNNQNQSNTYNEIASEDVLSTYDAVVAQSEAKDSQKHATHLRSLVSSISSSLQGVKLRLAEVTNKATSGYFMDNVVTVNINKLLPKSVTNFMSAGETIAHEYVHAVSSNISEISPTLARKAYDLYRQAKRTITWQDLIDPTLHPDDAVEVAKQLYNYMFEDNVTVDVKETVTTKQTVERKRSTRVAEFIALATTNENVARALDKIEPKSRTYSGFTAKVINLFSALLSTFFRKVDKGMKEASIHREMVDIIYTLAKLQNNHQSVVGMGLQKASDVMEHALNTGDEGVRNFLRKATEFSLKEFVGNTPVLGTQGSFTNPKSYLAAGAGVLSLYGRWDAVKEKVGKQVDSIGLFKNRTIRDIVTELTENTKDVNVLHDLISGRSQAIDIARQKTETEITRFIEKGLFSIPMSQKVSTALTHSVVTTDFNKLVKVFGADKALDILHSDNKRLHSLRKQYQNRLKAFKNSNYYINHAKALGEAMVNGNSIYYGVHSNAHSIARLAGDESFGSVEHAHLNEITELVDVLASLYAVMNVNPTERMRARNFLLADNKHRKENNLDSSEVKHVGLLALLDIQESAAKKALEKNFYSNPQLMQKGYIRETYNPNAEIKIVAADEVEGYKKQGFDVVGALPDGMDVSKKVMMVNHYSARLNYDQGAFSLTGFSTKGTKVEEDLLGSNMGDTSLVLTSRGKQTMVAARKSMFTSSPITIGEKSVSIAPVRNDDGNIVGYRYTMATQTKEDVLQRENRVSHVLARTTSSVEDKANSQVHNINVLKELYKMYDEDYKKYPDSFAFIGVNSDSPEYREMWAMLPSYTRAMVDVINAQKGLPSGVLPVPKKLLTLTFGSAPMTLDKLNEGANVNTRLAVKALTKVLTHKYGRMLSSLYKDALGSAKDTLVIKNITTTKGNIISNVFALAIAGIPMSYITKKSVQGWKEILQYQQLTQELGKLNMRLMHTNMSSNEANQIKSLMADLEGRISDLSITQLVDEGLYQTIVEDIDSEVGKQTYQSKYSELGDNLLKMTGKAETALREGVFITHDSMTYRYLRDAAQLSDFVSRYVMFSHMIEDGKSVQEAVHESRETFILYDAPLGKPLKFLNDLGFFNFSKFLLRTQGVLHKNLRKSPARVALYGALWASMGASATLDAILTPFNFMELIMTRAQLNPLGFIRNGLTELPIIKMLD